MEGEKKEYLDFNGMQDNDIMEIYVKVEEHIRYLENHILEIEEEKDE